MYFKTTYLFLLKIRLRCGRMTEPLNKVFEKHGGMNFRRYINKGEVID